MADLTDQKTDAPLQSDQEEKGTPPQDEKKDPSDNLTPDHPRFKQVIEEKNELKKTVEDLQVEMKELQESISKRQETTGSEELTSEEKNSLEVIDTQLRKRGYMTKDDFDRESRINQRASEIAKLSEKFDGSKGMPKFEATEVVAYAKSHGLGDNLLAAYREMNFDAIVQIEAKKANTLEAPESEKPTGGEERAKPKGEISPADVGNMELGEYEEKRIDILTAHKASILKSQVK